MSAGQVFFIDPARHPPQPQPMSRACIDFVMLWLGTIAGWATVAYGVYAMLMGNSVSSWPTTLVVVAALVALLVHPFGEMVLRRNWPVWSYIYVCLLFTATFGLMWVAAINWVIIKQGVENIEENWVVLQNTVLIPFTTQLDQKNYWVSDQQVLFGLGLTTGILRLSALTDAWKAVGGSIRLVQGRYGITLPVHITLFLAAAATLAYDDWAATVAPWAVPYSTAALLWQSAMAGLVIITIFGLLVAFGVWGSSYLTHALAAVILAPAGFVVLITSSVTLHRSSLVDAFVTANWTELHQFVPNVYAALSSEKYAMAAYTPMAAAGASGILLAVLILSAVGIHARCAVISYSVGADLYALGRATKLGGFTPLEGGAAAAGGAAAPQLEQGSTSSSVSVDTAATGGDRSIEFTSTKSTAFLPSPTAGTDIPAPASASARTSLASPSKSYGATTGSGTGGGGGFTSVSLGTPSGPVPPSNTFGISDEDYERAKQRATAAYAQYLAAHGVHTDITLAAYHAPWTESTLEKRVKQPPVKALASQLGSDLRGAWSTSKLCCIPTLLAALVFVIGMGVSLGQLQAVGTCGILARAAQEVTYTTSYLVTPGVVFDLANSYPYGSIEFVAPHFSDTTDHNVTVEVTYYAPDASGLPGYDAFLASFNETDYQDHHEPVGTDDNVGGYWYSTVSVAPPGGMSAATTGCLGARIRILTGARLMQVSVTSSRVVVNVTGNLGDLSEGTIAPIFASLAVATDTAPTVINNVYVDPFTLVDYNAPIPAHLTVTSNTGDIKMTTSTGPGITLTTGGTIRTSNIVSSSIAQCKAGCGDIELTATGVGRIAVSQALVANNIAVSTDSGVLVLANTGIILGRRMDIASNTGKIYMNNFLQASGNETFVSSSNDISISAAFVNRLIVTATGSAKVGVVEAFLGTATTTLVLPLVVGNYSDPLFSITTDRGAIQILGFGGSPNSENSADILTGDFRSNIGDIKVEVNGGGLNGNYTVSSARGSAVVELDGTLAGTTGVLGSGSSGRNYISLRSEAGDVQMSLLTSPL